MKKNRKKKKLKKIGLEPGSLIYTGEKKIENVNIRSIDYDESKIDFKQIKNIEDVFPLKETPATTWINIDGLHDIEVIEKIGNHFNIHPLVLEDILHPDQRPKMEDFEDYIFSVIRMFYFDEAESEVRSEQISVILGKNYVITFQEKPGDVFEAVRERLKNGKGRIRKAGAAYLNYALLDAVVDSYFYILEKLGEAVEDLEDELISYPRQESLQKIHKLRREMIYLRKAVWPTRELINSFQRRDSDLIAEETVIFFRDVYDHTVQVIDTLESYRDVVTGMLDTYLSSVSNRMNEVMKVLTIIATIFIPLTFLAGVYGMNFKHFPELGWGWIYPWGFWIVNFLIAGGMLLYFKNKHWL